MADALYTPLLLASSLHIFPCACVPSLSTGEDWGRGVSRSNRDQLPLSLLHSPPLALSHALSLSENRLIAYMYCYDTIDSFIWMERVCVCVLSSQIICSVSNAKLSCFHNTLQKTFRESKTGPLWRRKNSAPLCFSYPWGF